MQGGGARWALPALLFVGRRGPPAERFGPRPRAEEPRLWPCSEGLAASCPRFLACLGLQLHSGAAGTSEEANMDIISKEGTVGIK